MKAMKPGTTGVHQITIKKGEDLNKAINDWLVLQPEGIEIIKSDVFELSDQIMLIMTYKTNIIDLYVWVNETTAINLKDISKAETIFGFLDGYQMSFTMNDGENYLSGYNTNYNCNEHEDASREFNNMLIDYREGTIHSKNIDIYLKSFLRKIYGFGSHRKGFDYNYYK